MRARAWGKGGTDLRAALEGLVERLREVHGLEGTVETNWEGDDAGGAGGGDGGTGGGGDAADGRVVEAEALLDVGHFCDGVSRRWVGGGRRERGEGFLR